MPLSNPDAPEPLPPALGPDVTAPGAGGPRSADEVFSGAYELIRALVDHLARGEGLDGLAEELTRKLDAPVAFTDPSGRCLSAAGFELDAGSIRLPLPDDQLGSEGVGRVGDWVVCIARSGDETVGHVASWKPVAGSGDEGVLALQAAAHVAAIELARLSGSRVAHRTLCQALCDALVAGRDDLAYDLAHRVGVDPAALCRVVLVDPPSTTPTVVEMVADSVMDMGILPIVSTLEGRVVLVAERDVDWGKFGQHLGPYSRTPWRVGVGGPSNGLEGIKESLHGADLALRIGTALEIPSVTAFEDLGFCALVVSPTDPGLLRAFIDRWIGSLVQYDDLHHIELVRTLATFLNKGGALDPTAQALIVHRNTLKYRLQRIREISGHDLADPEVRFNLQVATRAHSIIDSLRRSDEHRSRRAG
ncbi:MAG TPA: helix-turn-helix domain-containing protein [Acidimicrobiales bacterium]|nr:helix-turn-helix domain-containing protein [Acidimicrobiales bacterium]